MRRCFYCLHLFALPKRIGEDDYDSWNSNPETLLAGVRVAWGFVIWGGLHGLMYVTQLGFSRVERRFLHQPHADPSSRAWVVLQVAITFLLVSLAWIPFRIHDPAMLLAIGKQLGAFGSAVHPVLMRWDAVFFGSMSAVFVLLDGIGWVRQATESSPHSKSSVVLELGFVNWMLILLVLLLRIREEIFCISPFDGTATP